MKRRKFLQSSGSALTLTGFPTLLQGKNLNSVIQLASVGTDGRGGADMEAMASHAKTKPIAFCEVDLSRTSKAKRLNKDAPIYQDFREMLENEGDKIDAVTIGIPDHMHAIVTLDALRRKKHVFCQKPLTHTVWEARQVRLQAEKSGVITRLGNQIHSHGFYRTAVQLVQSGAIGKVKRVHSWINAVGHGRSGVLSRPAPSPVPNKLDWNIWLGCAPERPFVEKIYHPRNWRDWQDFGTGALGDFGCHVFDPVFTALKIEQAPSKIKCSRHTGMNDEVWPAQNTVEYDFPSTPFSSGSLPITWNDGGVKPRDLGPHFNRRHALPSGGSLFIGEKGSLVLPHVGVPKIYPEEEYKDFAYERAENLNHFHGWLDGILENRQPSDGFSYAGPLTEAVLLGTVAIRSHGERLDWDAEKMKLTSSTGDRSGMLTKVYRKGWEIRPA
tara:strand:- start:879 stop:2201 length:1323 start_codon:yes stop_codon:yes gene_type:complete